MQKLQRKFQAPMRHKYEYTSEYSINYPIYKGGNLSLSCMRNGNKSRSIIQNQKPRKSRDLTPATDQRRALPVIPRKGVFNEWGAILKYNDEKDQLRDLKEKELLKMKQDEYRQDLENQITHQQSRSKSMLDNYLAEGYRKNDLQQAFQVGFKKITLILEI